MTICNLIIYNLVQLGHPYMSGKNLDEHEMAIKKRLSYLFLLPFSGLPPMSQFGTVVKESRQNLEKLDFYIHLEHKASCDLGPLSDRRSREWQITLENPCQENFRDQCKHLPGVKNFKRKDGYPAFYSPNIKCPFHSVEVVLPMSMTLELFDSIPPFSSLK